MRIRSVLDMSCKEARAFFLKAQSYCSFDMPPYFVFSKTIADTADFLLDKELYGLCNNKNASRSIENINHVLLVNKDGRYAWRSFELIHPAIYGALVNEITKKENWSKVKSRFDDFRRSDKISCLSIPVEATNRSKDREAQILNWWSEVEQRSIELALEYETIIHTDITDCYGQLYTHSIAWALHTKKFAKEKRYDRAIIGNVIDGFIRDMRHGQTNGIPQGSVLMDFIAEMVLGYIDECLVKKIKVSDYQILRYRDDYRIFTHSIYEGEKILKILTELLIEYGFKLNAQKTITSDNIVISSIKSDKLEWVFRKQSEQNIEKHLLIIHNHSIRHPNSGSLLRGLVDFRRKLDKSKKCDHASVLISIVTDIAYNNPRTYPICAAILSRLLSFFDTHRQRAYIDKIVRKFSLIPNTAYMEIWLQRIALPLNIDITFSENLCKLVAGNKSVCIWNNSWLSSKDLKSILGDASIIDESIIKDLNRVISPDEVELFLSEYSV